jgi:hypothetical protein
MIIDKFIHKRNLIIIFEGQISSYIFIFLHNYSTIIFILYYYVSILNLYHSNDLLKIKYVKKTIYLESL